MSPSLRSPELVHNLILVGGRGCGKSSVSRRILREDKRFDLLPLDTLIRYEAGGAPIPQIVERVGWAGFRELEFEVATKAGALPGSALLDCGGGIVVDLDEDGEEVYSDRKVAALRRHGRIVYLHRDLGYLEARIRGDRDRPDLSATRSFEEIMARRDPWYREAADWTFECSGLGKEQVVARVLEWFYAQCRNHPPGRAGM